MTDATHEEAVRLLKQISADTDIVLVVYREDIYYAQPSVAERVYDDEGDDDAQATAAPRLLNSNSNNAVSFASPVPAPRSFADTNPQRYDETSKYPVEV